MERIAAIRSIVPEASISTDIICGFCTETEEEFQDTISVIEAVKFELVYSYYYSERPGTLAAKKYQDDIPEDVKKRRLAEIVELHRKHSLERNREDIGKVFEVLLESISQKSDGHLFGRNSQNKGVVIPKGNLQVGQYVMVKITDCTSGTLIGEVINQHS